MSDSKSFNDVARELAAAHCEADPETREVYFAPDPAGAEIRLLEVTGSVNTAGEVLPFGYAPDERQGIPFRSVLVLLSPDDWRRCLDGELELPPGWGNPANLKKLA